jgi:hypothetical protein
MYISFDPEADEELYEAAGYFEERSRDGARFLADVGRTTGLLLQFPNVGTPVRGRFRRILLKTFPYQLVYRVDGKEIAYSLSRTSRDDLDTGGNSFHEHGNFSCWHPAR